MTRGRTLAVAILVTASCAPQGTDAERRRAAARADSSAAGYEVGPLEDVSAIPAVAATAPTVAGPTPRVAARTTKPIAAPAARPETTRARTSVATTRAETTTSKTAPRFPTAPAPVPAVPAAAAVDTGPVQDGEFLWYDVSQKLVKLRLVAGYSGINDGLNFNGGTNGNHTVVVPLGWRVMVHVANDDEALAHSALVALQELPVPPDPPAPAFDGAHTPSSAKGVQPGESDEMRFTASRAGQFLLMCGVPGHGEGGMWIALDVSETAAVPVYR